MDGTDFRFIILLEEIRNELKMIRRTLDVLATPQIEVHHIGRQPVVHNERCDCDKCTRPVEPKTSDP